MTTTVTDNQPTAPAESAAPTNISVGIKGMHCASCVGTVEKALAGVDGVTRAEVNLATERARIHAKQAPPARAVQNAVAAAGYTVADTTMELRIDGMTCASCVGRVERALNDVPGVLDATVNLATGKASVRHLAGAVEGGTLISTVAKAGYKATTNSDSIPADDHEASRSREAAKLKRGVLIASTAALPLFVLEMGSHFWPPMHGWLAGSFGQQNLFYLFFVLASIVQFGPGLYFYRTGWPTLVRGTPDMNSLVMLGTSAAYGYSVVATFIPWLVPAGTVHVYYEAAAMIITLILVGRYL